MKGSQSVTKTLFQTNIVKQVSPTVHPVLLQTASTELLDARYAAIIHFFFSSMLSSHFWSIIFLKIFLRFARIEKNIIN